MDLRCRRSLLVAHSVRGAVIELEPLPEDLRVTLESPRRRVREMGVAELADLVDAAGPGLALAARQALARIADEDHPQVAELARIAADAPAGAAADQVRRELTERAHREEGARQEAARREAEAKARREADTASPTTSEPPRQYSPAPNFSASLAVYLPAVALFRIFTRDRFVRMNAIQALAIYMIYAVAITFNALTVPHHSKVSPVSSQPWHTLLMISYVVGYCLATVLLLFCIVQLARQKQPRIFVLTRAAA